MTDPLFIVTMHVIIVTGRRRVRFPLRSLNLFNLSNPSTRIRPWSFSASEKRVPETEKQMFLGSKARPVRKADNLIAIRKPIV
jgi:hypothetical protein